MIKVAIKKATPSDWQNIQTLNHSIFAINLQFSPHIDPQWEYSPIGEAYFKKLCSDSDIYTLIAFADNTPVGYLNGFIKTEDYHLAPYHQIAVLENLGVLPNYQRQGIANALYHNFFSWVKGQNLHTISVESYYQNQSAINFYHSLGFTPCDITLQKDLI